MAYPPKFLVPETGPSGVKTVERADYEASDYLSTGMLTVGSREGIAADLMNLDFSMVSSSFRDTIVTLFNDTHGGIEFFGLIPPPSGTSRTPPAIGATRGQFFALWGDREAAVRNWEGLEGGSGGTVTYTSAGINFSNTGNTSVVKYAGVEVAAKLWPNLIYKLEYTVVGTGSLKMQMSGTWVSSMPYTGTFTQTQAQGAGSANVDGLISLDITAGDKSMYFVVPEYGNANPGSGFVIPGMFRMWSPIATYTGAKTTVLESATLTQVGSLYRFNSLDITKNSNAAYTIKVQLQENLATHLGSKVRNRQ